MALDILLLETGDDLLLETSATCNLILEPATAVEANTIATRLSGTSVKVINNSGTAVVKNGS